MSTPAAMVHRVVPATGMHADASTISVCRAVVTGVFCVGGQDCQDAFCTQFYTGKASRTMQSRLSMPAIYVIYTIGGKRAWVGPHV